jgi:hypothetical protein
MRKLTNALIVLLTLSLVLSAACSSAAAETTPRVETITQTVTVTQGATTTVSPTNVAPPPTTATTRWPVQITGEFSVNPKHAPVGATATASGTGFTANTGLELVWQDIQGSWDHNKGEFFGRVFKESWISLGTIQTDAQGGFSKTFTVPEGFGFGHDLVVLEGGMTDGTIRGKLGFNVDMQISLDSTSGPLGSPITVSISGMGWRDYENSWMLLYDNRYTGVLTTTTTHGMGTAVIPATGGTGVHTIQVLQGSFTFAFMNIAQSPFPGIPTWTFLYTITDGDPVLPPDVGVQSNAVVMGTVPAANGSPQIWTDVYLGPVGTPMNVAGRGLTPGAKVSISYIGMTGNRVDGKGYEEVNKELGTATVSASGELSFAFTMPDAHGGVHRLLASIDGLKVAETTFNHTPSVVFVNPPSGPVGTIMDLQLKGLGWTVMENNYYMTYDNGYVGYTCGFNNYGTIDILLPAAGEPGWHFIDFYPGVYKGTEKGKIDNFRVPYLTAADHPGEPIPVFHLAFYITG